MTDTHRSMVVVFSMAFLGLALALWPLDRVQALTIGTGAVAIALIICLDIWKKALEEQR